MRKTSSQLDWGVFVSFYSSDAVDYVSDSNIFPVDPSSTCYKWGPQQGDVSLFSLDGFSIGEHSHLSFGVKLQPRLKVIYPNDKNNVLRMAIGRLRWFNMDIKTNEIVYEQILDSNLANAVGGSGRRRNSFYFTGPPISGNVNETKKLKRHQLSKKVLGDEATLQIEYEAMKYFDPEQGEYTGQILILSTTLVMKSIEVLYNVIMKTGHRITCQVQLLARPSDSTKKACKRVQLTKVYLGRAQSVTTNEERKTRRMVWKSDPTMDVHFGDEDMDHFPGFTPRSPKQHHWEQHVEESQDMQLIQMLSKDRMQHARGDLSARHSISIPKTYIPDNDEYGNPTHRLPVFFCKDQQLTLKFFNFKFTPPRCVEHTLRWGDFEAADLRELMSPRAIVPEKQKTQKNPFSWMKKKIFSSNNKDVGMPPLLYTNEQRALERPLVQGLSLRVYFHRKKAHQVKLDSIALIADNYEETLDMLLSKVVTV